VTQKPDLWIIDDDNSIRWVLEKSLSSLPVRITIFNSADVAIEQLNHQLPDLVITDIRMPGRSGLDFLAILSEIDSTIPVIIMTAHTDLDSAVHSYQAGAFDYLPKPFDIDEAVGLVERALNQIRNRVGSDGGEDPIDHANIVGTSPSMQEIYRTIGRLSRSSINVLIDGESGTGKELVAQAIHRHSPRANKPFIALNMAAIPKDLLESELFGHERGAFTGASTARTGRFEQAHTGTLFLDEIGDMSADLQTRLLRVLADGTFYKVGGNAPITVDVRIVAATNKDLARSVADGSFREDLYHRLNVINIKVPPLRQRKDDIAQLAAHFLHASAIEYKCEVKRPGREALGILAAYDWPGNVRQLENTCRLLTVMTRGDEILPDDIPEQIRAGSGVPGHEAGEESWDRSLHTWASRKIRNGDRSILQSVIPLVEKTLIDVALSYTNGRKQDAAALLGWGRNTLTRKLAEHKIGET
jgi:two-component system nitrogen regulation response regulator GlnG